MAGFHQLPYHNSFGGMALDFDSADAWRDVVIQGGLHVDSHRDNPFQSKGVGR
jgi:hypothetical protein